jgi:peptidoglycan/xylan/chitin deacetylase (PgdA/CDA1 family)/GT2 family glycosyltransferase
MTSVTARDNNLMNTTTISVIIPSVGHETSLQRCLDSLKSQAFECALEIIVALDGATSASTDGVRQLRASRDWPWPIRWIELEARRGAAAARNRAAAEARGRHFIFLDDDMVAAPGFIAGHLEMLRQNPVAAIQGAIRTRCDGYSGVYRRRIETWWDQRHDRLAREPEMNFLDFFTGNLAMPSDIFRRVGGFDESLPACEDTEMGLRLRCAQVRMLYGPAALAIQDYRKGPSELMRDFEARGHARTRLWQSYPEARHLLTFERPGIRWLRKLALDARWRCESLAPILPWLPPMYLTKSFYEFLCEVAQARGSRREFADSPQWTALTEGTLLLGYHKFTSPRGKKSRYVIPIDQFERQLDALEAAGYRFIKLSDCLEAWTRGEVPGGKTAIITIDDGTSDLVEAASSILHRRRIPAVLYVVSDAIGTNGSLRADQIKALIADGWELGAHSRSHARLITLGERAQREEIAGSRAALSEITGTAPNTFCYPYGEDDATSRRLAEEAGYLAALGVAHRRAYLHSPRFGLPRLVVDGRWPLWFFKLIVSTGLSMAPLRRALRRKTSVDDGFAAASQVQTEDR